MSPFRLCRAGTAWELVRRILAVSLGTASAAICRHEIVWTRGDGPAALLDL